MTGFDLSLALTGRSAWLDRHRPLLSDLQLGLAVIGSFLWVASMRSPGAFRADTWGTMAHAIPAECWALAIMACAAMTHVGLIRPIRRHLVLIGGAGAMLVYGVLAVSAATFDGEVAIALFAVVLLLPLHGRLVWESVKSARCAAA